MSIDYILISIVLIIVSGTWQYLYFMYLPIFVISSLFIYLDSPLNTNIKGYLSTFDASSLFNVSSVISISSTMEPGYSYLIALIKLVSDDPFWIYAFSILLGLYVMSYSSKIILDKYFLRFQYIPLTTVLCAYYPILFIFQSRSGISLSIALLSVATLPNLFISLALFALALSIHIQSIIFLLFFLIYFSIESFIGFRFVILNSIKKQNLLLGLILLPILTFAFYYVINSGFVDSFLLRQGLRYVNIEKYSGMRLTGFFILLLAFPIFLAKRSSYIHNRHIIGAGLTNQDKLFFTSFITASITNIIFLGNLHLSTRLSRPFEFLVTFFVIVAFSIKSKNLYSRYIIAILAFILLYTSWSFKYSG